MTTLKGITVKVDRAYAPMLATAKAFVQSHGDVRIEWEGRSLQGFAQSPLEALAKQYDLILLDHPFVGTAAAQKFLLPLDEHLPKRVLATLKSESAGASHQSYFYDGHQWALAVDGAAQVAAYRPDLLEGARVQLPRTWEEVLELADVRQGFVTLPLLPVDALICFFSLCANMGEAPFSLDPQKVVTEEIGTLALERLKALAARSLPESLGWNPIVVWERMGMTDDIAYCPLGFGYSNYARPGYRKSVVLFTNIPSHGSGGPAGSTLGGAGLAISAECRGVSVALEYVQWLAGAECQRSVYFQNGGQPANRRAWTDVEVNRMSNGFFESTLETLEQAFLRPRFNRFVELQTAASHIISDFLMGNEHIKGTLHLVDQLYENFR